jgi:hypothetical protein
MEKKLLSGSDCYRILEYPAAALGTGQQEREIS